MSRAFAEDAEFEIEFIQESSLPRDAVTGETLPANSTTTWLTEHFEGNEFSELIPLSTFQIAANDSDLRDAGIYNTLASKIGRGAELDVQGFSHSSLYIGRDADDDTIVYIGSFALERAEFA